MNGSAQAAGPNGPVAVAFWADLSCPYAYLAHHRFRRVLPEFAGRVTLAHKSLALEYVNRQPTPKPDLDLELPFLMLDDPDLPYRPWQAPASEWPVTILPAFEAVKAAERQGLPQADDLAWAIRVAFFRDSRCISLRHVLLEIAAETDLEMVRFEADLDSGETKRHVIDESRDGWERTNLPGSPTVVLPNGERADGAALALPSIALDEDQGRRPTDWQRSPCTGDACLDLLRDLLTRALPPHRPSAPPRPVT